MSSIEANRSTPIISFVAQLYRPLEPYAYTLIRIAAGAIFVPHGVQKLLLGGASSALGYGIGVLELAGGLLLALGILTRPIALLLILDVAAIIAANIGKGWLWTRGGVQYHTFLLGMLLAVLIGGAGLHAVKIGMQGIAESLRPRLVPVAYAFARLWFALLILPSGYEKVSTAPRASRPNAEDRLHRPLWPVVALLEFFGMLLAAGLLTRPIAFMFAIELGVIVVAIQMPNGYFWTSRGAEFALALFLVCVAFVFGGGGRYSLDRRLGKEF
jgi:putative oxidoreductase